MLTALALLVVHAEDWETAADALGDRERWGVTGNLSVAVPIIGAPAPDLQSSQTLPFTSGALAVGARFGLVRPRAGHLYVTPAVALLATGTCNLQADCGGGVETRFEFLVAQRGGMLLPWFHQWVSAGVELLHSVDGMSPSAHVGVGLGFDVWAGVLRARGGSSGGPDFGGLGGGGSGALIALAAITAVALAGLALSVGHVELRYTVDARAPAGFVSVVAGVGI